jgi:hypothetical protein
MPFQPRVARPLPLVLAALALAAGVLVALLLAGPAAAAPSSQSAGKAFVGRGVATSGRRQPRRHHAKRTSKTVNATPGTPVTPPTPAGGGSNSSKPPSPSTPSKPKPTKTPTTPTTPATPTAPSTPTAAGTLLDAGFESNLAGWNIGGVGEVVPTVTTALARTGAKSCRFALNGTENRSELVLGGNGSESSRGTAEFFEGSEAWYGFSVYVKKMVYGKPGAHNSIMQFKSDGTGSPEFALQLWNVNGKKGLWTGGPAQEVNHSGERFLAPLAENAWHDIEVHFRASEGSSGFYEVFLDGNLVDSQKNVRMIVPGRQEAYIKTGLYRNGSAISGESELFVDAAKLGTTQASVLPG